jgi:hypothetical protein
MTRKSSNLGQYNMIASPTGLGPENDCAGEVQQTGRLTVDRNIKLDSIRSWQVAVVLHAPAAVIRGRERGKLKNLHC